MRLRKECEHDRYDPHTVVNDARGDLYDVARCPGGEFLPEGALLIEPGHEKEVALAILKDLGVLHRFVSADRQVWRTQWEWSDEFMKQKSASQVGESER